MQLKRFIWFVLLSAVPVLAQVVNPGLILTADSAVPTGSCSSGVGYLGYPSGHITTCQSGTWTVVSGGGSFNALTNDATSTSTGGSTTVVGINSTKLSTLATGLLKNTTGTGVPSIAATTDIATLLGGAGSGGTACSISNSLYSPNANGCFTPAITNSGTAGNGSYYAATGNTVSPDTTWNIANSTHVDTSTNGLNTTQIVVTGSPATFDPTYPNDGTTGSITSFLNKVNASGNIVEATTSDTGIPVFPVASSVSSNGITICSAATSGKACKQVGGQALVTFDASGGSLGQWCVESTTTAGTCHAVASPSGQYCVGQVVANVAGSAIGTIDMSQCTLQNPAGNGTVSNSSTAGLVAYYSTTGTTVSGDANLDDGHTTANTLTYAGTAGISTPYYNATGTQSGSALGLKLGTNTGLYNLSSTIYGVFNASTPVWGVGNAFSRLISTGAYGWTSGANVNSLANDTIRCRAGAAGLDEIEAATTCTNTVAGATGGTVAAMFEHGGTAFTSSAGCSDTTLTGGATGGHFTVGTSSACTTVITMGNSMTAAHGWVCTARDITTPANLVSESATTTTTVTLGGTFSTSDVIWFSCDAV